MLKGGKLLNAVITDNGLILLNAVITINDFYEIIDVPAKRGCKRL